MITVKARINITGKSKGNLTGVDISPNGNNVSANGSALINKRGTSLGNPFILGRSILGKGATYVKTLPYFMGSVLSNTRGNFKETYTIQVSGKDLTAVILVFDKENNYHPNSLSVDGEILIDDDSKFEIPLKDSAQETHTIQISNWNAANEPLIISGIYADIAIDIDQKNLVSFRNNVFDREDEKYPTYGIISNSATLNFADFDEQALDLIKQKILHSGITVTAWVENEEANIKKQICEMQIRDLTYENNNRQVQVSLKDNIEDLQEVNIDEITYDPRKPHIESAKWIFDFLYEKTKELNKYNLIPYDELDQNTQWILANTPIQYPLLEAGTLWDGWSKLCELCLLHIYIDNDNRFVIKYGI